MTVQTILLHNTESKNPLVADALRYAEKGWLVFPLHAVKDGKCTCVHNDCASPGKHPRTVHGLKQANKDLQSVKNLFSNFTYQSANIAICTGRASNLIVVDVDAAKGGQVKELYRLVPKETLAKTLWVKTGGGYHLYFSCPQDIEIRNSVDKLGTYIDVRGEGGYVVAPPSMHISGKPYEFLNNSDLMPFPQAFIEKLNTERTQAKNNGKASSLEMNIYCDGQRNDSLASIAGKLRRAGLSESELKTALLKINLERCKPPVTEKEVLRIAHSISRYDVQPESQIRFNSETNANASQSKEKENSEDFEETEIIPFPVPSAKCFYGLAGEFVRMIEPHTESDLMALLIQFLTYFGNIIGRSAFYLHEADKHFTNLISVLVGDTASGRKGTSLGRVKEVFKGEDEAHEKDCIVSGLASGEGLLYHIRDAVWEEKTNKKTKKVETVCTDAGVSDKRLLIVEGEFAQVLRVQGREGNTLSAFLRNLWDNGTARNLTKNSPLRTTDALVSIIGHITKTELLNCLTEVESVNGYANRFLWFAVRRSKFLPFGAGEIDLQEYADFQRRLSEKIKFARSVQRMIFTAEARNLFASEYQRLETSRYGFLAKVTQRATAYVCRLSCVFALLDGKDEIEREHLEVALAVWQYSEDSARYIFGTRSGDKNADIILNALREADGGLTRTQIRDLFDRHISKGKLDSALQTLLENGFAKCEKAKTNGRTKEKWFACVFSVFSVLSQENHLDEQPFNAKNAVDTKNKHAEKELCPTCNCELDQMGNGQLFCEICLYTKS